jgi:glycosyltransferase involved in cell wall biosynthesis
MAWLQLGKIMDLKKLSVTILTKNSAKYLEQILEALKEVGEVVILDSGSTDKTLQIASSYPNISIHKTLFDGFGPVHNRASGLAKHEWIFSLDSDEIPTPEFMKELRELPITRGVVYGCPRLTYYHGKPIYGCGWYPDTQWRIYNREDTRFTDVQVHERVITDNLKTQELKAPLIHYSYADTADFLHKMQQYSTLFAEQNRGVKKSSLSKAILHASFAFFKSYFLKRGFLEGREGFIISVYQANTAFYKYLKLAGY